MCEIAVLDPDQAPISAVHQIAARFHDEQGDGIGVLAVHNHGDAFSYNTYKSINPHWQTLYSFLKRNYDSAWRIIVHGRAATAGGVNRDNAHPVDVDCQHCDVDYVVHNGSVRNHQKVRSGLQSQGHSFETKVDTEIIGHKVGEIPNSVDDHSRSTYSISGNLNYIVCSTDGILVRVTSKYHLTDKFTMTCSLGKFDNASDLGFESGTTNEWMLVQPDGADPSIETKDRTVYNTSRSATSTAQQSAASRYNDRRWSNQTPDSTYTIEYEDHSEFESVTAIKVAPGVMKIIDGETEKEMYVFRDEDPRLYYYYSPEPAPDNINKLEELASVRGGESNETEQARLEDFPVNELTYAVVEEVSTTIAQEVDGVDVSDLAEARDELMHSAADASTNVMEIQTMEA